MEQNLPYLEKLNEMQLEAVLHVGSPLLILAGAGTGKTRVITAKIAYFIDSLGIPPWSILAVTFTNKAAKEMRERVCALNSKANECTLRTFHAFCAYILRLYGEAIGLPSTFTIYDDDESLTLLKNLFPNLSKDQHKLFSRLISKAKDLALLPSDNLSAVSDDELFGKVYKAYQRRLDEIGNCDFGDLILKTITLLKNNPQIKQKIQNRYRVILVDEYQDSNIAQFQLLQQLYSENSYLAVVGDDDQSIYKFRGAEVENILTFDKSFPNTKIIRLEQNYRSTANILKAAGAVVANNSGRLGKNLWTAGEEGDLVELQYLDNQKDEANLVLNYIDKNNPSATAVLFRTNAQSRPFEDVLGRNGIPYRVVGALRFLDREEIKDIVSYLALFLNGKDEIAFARVVNKPARSLGPATVKKILDFYRENNYYSILDAAKVMIEQKQLSANAADGLAKFLSIFSEGFEQLKNSTLEAFIQFVLEKSGLSDHYKSEDLFNETYKSANLGEFISKANDYEKGIEGLVQLLQDINLDNDLSQKKEENEQNGVVLITMHNTKGLEFDQVIITGMEEDLFPSKRSKEEGDIEEERRICYVAMTRARKKLVMTTCQSRLLYGRVQYLSPSQFIKEIPNEFLSVKKSDAFANLFKNAASFSSLSKYGNKSNYGYGYNSNYNSSSKSNYNSAFGYGSKSSSNFVKSAADDDNKNNLEWKIGQAVYHHEYGSGVVVNSSKKGEHELVIVRFSTGAEKQFFPSFSQLEKISND